MLELFLALILGQAPAINLPKDLTVKPGRLLKIEATSAGKSIRWANTSDDADLIVSESGRWAIFSSTVPGVYKVFAWTAAGDNPSEASICAILVSDPNPQPNPPAPEDALKNAIKAIYGADNSPGKKGYKDSLQALWLEVAKKASDLDIRSVGELFSIAKQSSLKILPPGALLPIREKIATDINENLPTDPQVELTVEIRSKAAKLFNRYAEILGGVD
jgi:hypothetical protein